MKTEFITWLTEELNRRGWSNSELSRRAGVVPSAISMVISGQRGPGHEFCRGIARALRLPPEEVFRHAGLLPPLPSGDAEAYLDAFRRLSPRLKEIATQYVAHLYQQEQEGRL